MKALKERDIIIKGAGEMATGIACRLYRSGFRRLLMLETPFPWPYDGRYPFAKPSHDGVKQWRASSQ